MAINTTVSVDTIERPIEPSLRLTLRGQGSSRIPPSFDSPLEARRYCKERLAAAYRIFHKLGFDEGIAGHITLRDPINSHAFWLAPFSIPFEEVCASDLLLIDHEGNVIEGGKPGDGQLYNAAGFTIHGCLHASRDDINAAAHAHSTYGKAYSALGRNLDVTEQDDHHAQTIRLYNSFGGVVLEDEEAKRLCASLGETGKGLILKNHGLMGVGRTVEAAVAYYVRLEQLCQSQLLSDAAGYDFGSDPVDDTDIFGKYGGEEEAYFQALALFDAVEQESGGSYKN